MIGTVTWTRDPITTVATLHDDRTWTATQTVRGETVDAPEVAGFLAATYEDHYQGPSDGPYGVRILNELAAERHGVVWFEAKKHAPPGTVY